MTQQSPDYRSRILARSHLSPSYRLVCDYLLRNYIVAAMSTANQVATAVNVDTTTVVRCAQVLGYAGWPELQEQLKAVALAEFAEDQGAGKKNYIDALNAWERYEACRRAAAILPGSEHNAKAVATAYRRAREITDYCLAQPPTNQ